ncbi:MAG: xanthine dehydrogenase family protein subunit M [Planctomycetaceae bacterium]|nr:xanthine dehydrogenase family protein subunit M [Planctomycetaceae bacterium]
MRNFDYAAPATLADTVKLLAGQNGRARPLAGGTDLIDHVRTGRLAPDIVVDIKQVPELNIFEFGPQSLRLGAAVPCWRVYGSDAIKADYAALADACMIIGGIQIQNRASVGGNLCNSGPAADSTPALIALGAVCVIAGAQGSREVPVEQFCTGPGKNILQPGELLVELRIPKPPANSGSHYRRFIPRNEMDIAVVGVGASVVLDAAKQTIVSGRIGLGAVAPTPLFAAAASAALAGKPATEATFRAAGEAARQSISPIDDMRGTREFRLQLTGVLVERVLTAAVERARSR